MQLLAPAKINLSLRILNRRADGFHEIDTLIAPISLYDELSVEKNKGGIKFLCDEPSVPTGDDNLVVWAAKIFFERTNLKPAVAIELRKKIPQGAGLGGGSSDAAATLIALNQLFKTKISREELAELGSAIGSDVPFFIFGSAATCKGRGEIIAPTKLEQQLRNTSRAPIISGLSILLLKPGFQVSTAWAYARWQHSRELLDVCYRPQEFAGQTFVNDLERPVFEKFVFLAELKMWLLKQPEVGAALMSGSGSTVFAVVREMANVDLLAQRAKSELDPELWMHACETV